MPAFRVTGTLTVSTLPQSPVEENLWRAGFPALAETFTERASPLTYATLIR